MSRWRGDIGRFLSSSHGTSTIEHALFVALVIGASLAAVEGLGIVGHSTFFAVARGMQGESDAAGNGDASRYDEVARSRREVEFAAADDVVLPARFLLLLIACPFGAACWYLLYRDSRKRRLAPVVEENEPAPVAEQDSVFLKRHDLLRSFSGDVGIFFTSRMKVRQVMTRDVVRVLPSESMDEVRRLLSEKRIRHVLVCDKRDRLLGVISDRDLHAATARVAKDAMADHPVSVEPDTLVNPAVTLLLQKRISCLPVLDDGRVVGVVTTTDLLMALQCTLHALQRVGSEAVANLPPDTVPGFMIAAFDHLHDTQPEESLTAANS